MLAVPDGEGGGVIIDFFFQKLENGIDTLKIIYLHSDFFEYDKKKNFLNVVWHRNKS